MKPVEIYRVKLNSAVNEGFSLDVNCINAKKSVLTYLPNPQIKLLKYHHKQISRLKFCDKDITANQLPIHVILGAAYNQQIRSTEPPVLRENLDTNPGAGFTMFGWILYGRMTSTDEENDNGFFVRSGQNEFERLYALDVLGLSEDSSSDKQFHQEFQGQLRQKDEGFYET